uniref:Uncharacterized protein n=1 Tax=Globodera rostochiensis TaxID=31243 RepID=A0A914HJA3_GLORO
MTEANWAEPSGTIRRNAQSEVSLPPPQFYELLRIQRLKCVQNDKIQNMIDPRRITPHIFRSIEGPGSNVHVLPGDHLYDETNPDFTPPTFGHGNELNPPYPEDRTKPIHRIIFYSEQKPLQYHKLKLFVRNFDSSSKKPHLFHTNDSSVNTAK